MNSLVYNPYLVDKQLLRNNSSTGLISFGGLSINTDNTKFNVGAIKGWFIDNLNPENPLVIYKEFNTVNAISVTNILTQNVSYIAIDKTGVIHQNNMPFESHEQRDLIPLGVVVHSNRTNINAINNQPVVNLNINNQLSDLIESIGFFNVSGNVFSANDSNLSINKSAGYIFKQGSNFLNNNKNPHILELPFLSAPTNIRYRLRNGTEYADTAFIDPNNWDNNGVLTAMTGTRWSIQRIFLFQSNLVRIQYGQETYSTLANALQAISTESFIKEQNIAENGLFRALLLVKRNATDLSDPTRALFLEVPKFDSISGLGNIATTSLQQAYNNSTEPEITTNSDLGAVTIKRGTGLDSDNVFEIKNAANSVTSYITGEGNIKGKSLLLEQLTTTEINALIPVTGQLVYNTTLDTLCFYNGTQWRKVTDTTM